MIPYPYVIGNVQGLGTAARGLRLDEIACLRGVEGDVHFECLGGSLDLEVVAVGTALCHAFQVSFKCCIHFRGGGCSRGVAGGKGASVLPLRVSSSTTSGSDGEEVFVVITIFPHDADDSRANGFMSALVAIHLICEGMKEAVSYARKKNQHLRPM